MADLVAWHGRQADRAAQQAQAGRDAAALYHSPLSRTTALALEAGRHNAVADAAAALSRFHAEAADICAGYL